MTGGNSLGTHASSVLCFWYLLFLHSTLEACVPGWRLIRPQFSPAKHSTLEACVPREMNCPCHSKLWPASGPGSGLFKLRGQPEQSCILTKSR